MKLRNKKTWEIGWLYCDHISVPKKMTVFSEDKDLSANYWDYTSLAELNADWEDVPEEPEEFYIVEHRGRVGSRFRTGDEYEKTFKEIGNYFETKEEAELAVRKLKAWKRLKDRGFKFEGRAKPHFGEKFIIRCSLPKETLVNDVTEDLDLLFGGKE